MDPVEVRPLFAMGHLAVLALWGGVVATEAVIENAILKQFNAACLRVIHHS